MHNIQMTKHHIITTTNEIDTYYTFLPTVYRMYKKHLPDCVFVLGVITNQKEDSYFVKRCKEFSDQCFIFPEYPDIHSGVQAKTTRMYLATKYGENVCTLVDIDQYIMNFKWLKENLKPVFDNPNKMVSIGYNGYVGLPHEGKWQMPFTTARSNLFKKIVNYNNYDTYEKWLFSFKTIPNPIDNKETITNAFNNFSDESLLRYLVERHPETKSINANHIKQDYKGYVRQRSPYRIDRGAWYLLDLKKLYNNYYLDCFPIRPFNKNFTHLIPILHYLGIGGSKDQLFF